MCTGILDAAVISTEARKQRKSSDSYWVGEEKAEKQIERGGGRMGVGQLRLKVEEKVKKCNQVP